MADKHMVLTKLPFKPACILAGLATFVVAVDGCSSKEDTDIEVKLHSVAVHRSEHVHYPIMVFGDFKSDNQPAGIGLDVYSFYVHETTKPNAMTSALSPSAAEATLEHTFEKALQSVVAAEAASPPPRPPLPNNSDWIHAPHPKLGTYRIVSQFGKKARAFDIPFDSKHDIAEVRPILAQDAQIVVGDGLRAQNEALQAAKTPCGFTLCTSEILKLQQGNRGVEPHLIGGPLLLTPVDRQLALKGLEQSILKLVGSTSKIQPPPSTAHLVVDGPEFNQTYEIPIGGPSQDQAIKTTLESLGAEIDNLNKKAK
jgi:hypothetical protein